MDNGDYNFLCPFSDDFQTKHLMTLFENDVTEWLRMN